MSSNFIIVPKAQSAPKDTSPAALTAEWFSSVRGIAPTTTARLQEQVQRKLETGSCRHLSPKMPAEYLPFADLQAYVEQVIDEQWDSLTPEERLLTRFPTIQAVGDTFEIPSRGTGIIIQRELTRRFGVEMVFELRDGTFFKWEFID